MGTEHFSAERNFTIFDAASVAAIKPHQTTLKLVGTIMVQSQVHELIDNISRYSRDLKTS